MSLRHPAFAAATAFSLALALSACGSATTGTANRFLNSVHQPVVSTATTTLDLSAHQGGLPQSEQLRLSQWLTAMGAGFGDRINLQGPASETVRADVAAIVARRGLMLNEIIPSAAEGAGPGTVRVAITRATAHVPGCSDWTARTGSATGSTYGCAINSNLAAMVANPQDLIEGVPHAGDTIVMTSNKAIASYREAPVTGERKLAEASTTEE